MPKIYIDYESQSIGGRALGKGPYADREDEHRDLTVNGLKKSKPQGFWGGIYSLEVDDALLSCEMLHLVVVRYTTGDSFGKSCGNYEFFGARASRKEALQMKAQIEQEVEDDKKPGSKVPYRPWIGYLERLERVEIDCLPLDD